MTYTVLVCDDDVDLAAGWSEEIRQVAPAQYEIGPAPTRDDVRDGTKEILLRRGAARDGEPREQLECLFDGVDILLIDYDLVHIDDDNAQHTGESVARLVRTFSDCTVAVVLNQFPGVHFDLSLRGHITSHADLNIDVDLIANPGLWHSPPWEGFRPWYWQTLARAVDSQRAREEIVASAMAKPILDCFRMQAEDASRLSDSAFAFVAPDAEDFPALQAKTFESFLSMTADGRDAASLLDTNPAAAASFVAARLGKWLEREVLGPQDVLVDVPHLLQRYPFLMGEAVSDVGAWNNTIHDVDRLKEVIQQHYWFEPQDCLSKPAVWCQRLEMDEKFTEFRQSFDYSSVPEVVFSEDCSVFIDISEATEFRAGFHNSFDRRFVSRLEDIQYGPQRRFAFGT